MKEVKSISAINKFKTESINVNDLYVDYNRSCDFETDIYLDDLKYNSEDYLYEYDKLQENKMNNIINKIETLLNKEPLVKNICIEHGYDVNDEETLYYIYSNGILDDILRDCGIGILETEDDKYNNYKELKNPYVDAYYNKNEDLLKFNEVIWECPECDAQNYDVINIDKKETMQCYKCKLEINKRNMSKKSKGEMLVEKLLKLHKLEFSREFEYKYNGNKKPLRYDFIVNHNDNLYFIEVNGLQHYKPIDYFGGEKAFKRGTYLYNIKKKNAQKLGIFIELDYKESDLGLLKERFDNEFYNKFIKGCDC